MCTWPGIPLPQCHPHPPTYLPPLLGASSGLASPGPLQQFPRTLSQVPGATILTDASTSELLPHQCGLRLSTSSLCTPSPQNLISSKSQSKFFHLAFEERTSPPSQSYFLPSAFVFAAWAVPSMPFHQCRAINAVPSMPCPFSASAAPHSGMTSCALTFLTPILKLNSMLCILLGILSFSPTKCSLSYFQAWLYFYFLFRLYHQACARSILKWKFQLKGFLSCNCFPDAPQLLHTQPPHSNTHPHVMLVLIVFLLQTFLQ